jgi:Tfp pilus assembly protein PilN
MKLNLLPTYVSKDKQVKSAVVLATGIGVLAIVASVLMIVSSQNELKTAKAQAEELVPRAEEALRTAQRADAVAQSAAGIVRNINLSQAMITHNASYPALYDEVKMYIPAFYRVVSMSARPNDGATSTVTLNGYLRSYQQYADLMLSLYRIPGAVSVTRGGFEHVDPFIPAMTEGSQGAAAIRPGEQVLPDDPLERLDYLMARGSSTGFQNVGGFGAATSAPRGAMPDWSAVSVDVVIPRNLQVPNARASLAAVGAPAAGAPGMPPGAPPGAPRMGGL